jgi:hypothetical protein
MESHRKPTEAETKTILMHARRVAERDGDPAHALALGAYPAILRYCSSPSPDMRMLEKVLALSVNGTAVEAGLCIYNECVSAERRMTMEGMLAAANAQLERDCEMKK